MAAVAPKTNDGHSLGTGDLRWSHVYATNIDAAGNVTIAGDLTITGSSSQIDVQTLAVEDALIHLAKGNNGADSLDTGFFIEYGVNTV